FESCLPMTRDPIYALAVLATVLGAFALSALAVCSSNRRDTFSTAVPRLQRRPKPTSRANMNSRG
ncbi:MAG: hypothetical protein WA683_18445, partial [Pseudolabrys sp.]